MPPVAEQDYHWRQLRSPSSRPVFIITEGTLRGTPYYLRNELEAVDAGKHPAACDMKMSWGLTTQSATLLAVASSRAPQLH